MLRPEEAWTGWALDINYLSGDVEDTVGCTKFGLENKFGSHHHKFSIQIQETRWNKEASEERKINIKDWTLSSFHINKS